MDEIDKLLDALWTAAIEGDAEAAVFLQMFAPWAAARVHDALARGGRDGIVC